MLICMHTHQYAGTSYSQMHTFLNDIGVNTVYILEKCSELMLRFVSFVYWLISFTASGSDKYSEYKYVKMFKTN